MKLLTIERVLFAGAILAASVAWTGRAGAQATQPPADVLPALLTEVRGLRAAMEQMASAGPRVQLFASRLQLQETRINNMLARLSGVRDRLNVTRQSYGRGQTQIRQLEAALAEQRASATPEAREEAKQAAMMLEEAKQGVATLQATIDQLMAEENQLTGDIATEQARWNDINSRLDELEKLLSRR